MERKDAIEIFKKNYPDSSFTMLREALETLIPELNESEDEKMWKLIKKYAHYNISDMALEADHITREQLETWLEKQGEKKSIWHTEEEDPKRGSLILLIMQSGTPIVAQIIEPNHTFNHGERWAYIDDLLEKQGEQKPQGKTALEAIKEEKVDNANKVEPKFKVGDWISSYYTNYKVLSVYNDAYLVEDVDGNKINILFENEKFHHLFTIADAKDGDVLCCESGWTCIFKALNNNTNTFSSYCFMDNTGWFYETGSEAHTLEKAFIKAYNGNIYPATKEQRDIFFQKMKEAGYEWDVEKKELKKIKQKEVIHKELTEFEKAVKQVMEEAIECGDTHNLKADADMLLSLVQKSAWSEEDECCINQLIVFCENCMVQDSNTKKCANWLKSLKERYTWKPSDEQIKAVKEAACYSSVFSEKTIDNLISLSKDLKKLKG